MKKNSREATAAQGRSVARLAQEEAASAPSSQLAPVRQMRLRVGIDARVLAENPPFGVSRWTAALLQTAAELAPHHDYLLYLDDRPLADPTFCRSPFSQRPVSGSAVLTSPLIWQQCSLPWAARRDQVDVLLSPYYCGPLFSHAPQIVCLHDISFALFPGDFPSWVRFKPKLLARPTSRRAVRVMTISEFSRQEILRVYRLAPEKVVVIPPGHEDRFWHRPRSSASKREGHIPDAPFFLFVGSLLPRRQVGLVIEALARLPEQYHFVVVGEHSAERRETLRAIARQWQVVDRVQCLGHVADEDLDNLYYHALALVSPSTYEGFGLPVLEAMRRGLPVIAWDIPVMREVAADSVLLLPVGDITGLATAMARVASDPAKRQALGQSGKERAQNFSWRRSAAVFLNVLQEIVSAQGG